MIITEKILGIVRDAAGVGVTPAPHRKAADAVVYRWYPGGGDGALVSGRLELRFTAFRFADAMNRMSAVKLALLGKDGSAVIGEGAERIIIRRSQVGGKSGYISGCGLYFVKTSFDIQGRSDIYGG